ncbi:MAG: hypothetical protein QNJ03_12155 [Dinoroseobacter sp.]|nr:hypothetical protein [Dinoroseobacter sp.]
MKTRVWIAMLCAGLSTLPAAAQDAPGQPISAIDWLSDVIQSAPTDTERAPDISGSAAPERIEIEPLAQTAVDAVGLLPANVVGLPRDFWGPSPSETLAGLMRSQSSDLNRPARRLLKRILLAELDPPVDADTGHDLFLARVDTLLAMGALEDAQALVERAGVTADPDVFRRWFDISLLRETENRACATLRATPDVAPTFSARIFCLARNRDWPAAALSLETARALGAVSDSEADLMARFLDPIEFEDDPFPPVQRPITPLDYRMRAALGEAPPSATLPLAFNHALLSDTQGWKTRLEAAERLARAGGISPLELFAIYLERAPAASGGLWDRVANVQKFDIALLANDPDRIASTLPPAASSLESAGLFEAFSEVYGGRVARLDLAGEAGEIAETMVLYTPAAEAYAPRLSDPLRAALARGEGAVELAETPLQAATTAAFADRQSALPLPYETLISQNRNGEATLRALQALGQAQPDPNDTETALRVLRRLGFESAAREIALALVLREARV